MQWINLSDQIIACTSVDSNLNTTEFMSYWISNMWLSIPKDHCKNTESWVLNRDFSVGILLKETHFKWSEVLWKQKCCGQWMAADTDDLDTAKILRPLWLKTKCQIWLIMTERSTLSENPLKSIIRTKTRHGMYENSFSYAIHAWKSCVLPFWNHRFIFISASNLQG